ncbi:hypothetical protein DIPPA_30717 [Diplonema papillatum]|nr:hypothetical protein DIPPA_30717 [Diplonema papillatum]
MTKAKPPHAFKLPPGFDAVLMDFTREALREQPADVYEWAAQYFKAKALDEDEDEKHAAASPAPPPAGGGGGGDANDQSGKSHVRELSVRLEDAFFERDAERTGKLFAFLIKRTLVENVALTETQAQYILSTPSLTVDAAGRMDYHALSTQEDILRQIVHFQTTGHDIDPPSDETLVHGLTRSELRDELALVFPKHEPETTNHVPLSAFREALEASSVQFSQRAVNLIVAEATLTGKGEVPYKKMLDEHRIFELARVATALETLGKR